MTVSDRLTLGAPVNIVSTGSAHDDASNPLDGIALCLSGGGYRAMLFHLGALWRLNELAHLSKLARVSSVSGGSITAGVLGLNWTKLAFDASGTATGFDANVVQPIRALASKTIDEPAILEGIFLPGSIADRVVGEYRKHLFGNATLQDLPPDPPRFVINSTSVQSGALFRFSRPFAADYRVGVIPNPTIALAVAVAASSAFPPLLSPLKLKLDPAWWAAPSNRKSEDLHKLPYLSEAVLSDGGVYDNLGLETAWKKYKTVLVSNGGGKMQPDPDPAGNWVSHSIRINEIIDNQVRSLRVRELISGFDAQPPLRAGTYWGIRTDISDYQLQDSLPCPLDKTLALAETPTRLKELDAVQQERLINWGYAVCDAGMRRHVIGNATPPAGFPYPKAGVG
jgi:NTE family protein